MLKLHRPSPALVIACVALFVAASGGAWAATTTQTGTRATTATPGKPKMKRGPRGFRGRQGPAGHRGVRGPAGLAGTPGLAGAPGGRHRARQHQRHRRLCHVTCTLDQNLNSLVSGSAEFSASNTFGRMITLTDATTGGVVKLSCNPDNGATARNTVITAIQVGTLHTQ